jgi:hypothetical protein
MKSTWMSYWLLFRFTCYTTRVQCVPLHLFSVSAALYHCMWANSTPDSILGGIFSQIFRVSPRFVVVWLCRRLGHVLPAFEQADKTTIIAFTLIPEYILFKSLFWVPVLGHRLRGYRVHILYEYFFFWSSNSLFQTTRGSGGYTQWVHFVKSAHHLGVFKSTSWLHSWKHSNYTCFYSAYLGATRRLPSSTMICSGAWQTIGIS